MAIVPALILGLALASGCGGVVGAYFAERGRDFSECWRAEAGTGYGLAIGLRGAGIIDVGVGGGLSTVRGYVYGHVVRPSDFTGMDVWFPVTLIDPEWPGVGYLGGTAPFQYRSFGILPCVLSSTNYSDAAGWHWIWSAPGRRGDWARLHSFDVELTLLLGVGIARVGFSPGEFVDFLLGWFGLDIADDDRPWAADSG